MAKKTTLDDLAAMLTKQGKEIHDLTETVGFVVKHMATKDDIADLRRELKSDIVVVAQQINAIETELRGIKRDKLTRVADLEDEVFGQARG